MSLEKKAIVIGNSDGIGLALTERLLETGWRISGFSRSPSPINNSTYEHRAVRVDDESFPSVLSSAIGKTTPDLCVYCAGTGEILDPLNMEAETRIFDVNLTGMVKTVSCILPEMVRSGKGHFIGLSSIADGILSPDSPSYSASKAGFSAYLESLALALRPRGVFITNVRFGFVDTKMAISDIKPFMMSTATAVDHLLKCIEKRPVRYSAPKIMLPVVFLFDIVNRFKVLIT